MGLHQDGIGPLRIQRIFESLGVTLHEVFSNRFHRPQKIEVYNGFFEILERFLKNPDEQKVLEEGGEEDLPEDLRDQFWQLNKGLIVWGSPAVIKSWLHFRKVTTSGGNTLLAMDNVLKAIRKDLGNSNFGLQVGDSVKVFLRDPSEVDTMSKADKNV
mgnify:CR=1 FL=1